MIDEKKLIEDFKNTFSDSVLNQTFGFGKYTFLEAIEEMINRQPQIVTDTNVGSKWIPCSERLPNRNEVWIGTDITDAEPREFIVMVKGAYEPTTGYYTVDGWIKGIYDKENGSGYANEIIAWRFFPEPYKGE